nr:MAG TPA: hypothetical protein [Crassvirales sp.]
MAENKEKKKLTYEQLNEVANQLVQENMKLKQKCQELYMADTIKRLEFLFKVVESIYPFSAEFRDTCAKEIIELMTPVQENKEDKESE